MNAPSTETTRGIGIAWICDHHGGTKSDADIAAATLRRILIVARERSGLDAEQVMLSVIPKLRPTLHPMIGNFIKLCGKRSTPRAETSAGLSAGLFQVS